MATFCLRIFCMVMLILIRIVNGLSGILSKYAKLACIDNYLPHILSLSALNFSGKIGSNGELLSIYSKKDTHIMLSMQSNSVRVNVFSIENSIFLTVSVSLFSLA